MHQADANGQLEAIALPVHAARHEDLQHVPVVLLEPPDALVPQPAAQEERLADVRRKAFNQDAANHSS